MSILAIRLFFIFLSTVSGYYVGLIINNNYATAVVGAFIGFVVSMAVIITEIKVQRVSTRNLSAAVFGLLFGLFMAWLLSSVLMLIPMDERVYFSIHVALILLFCYLGMVIAMRGKDDFSIVIPYIKLSRQDQSAQLILVDTSVIIDGRISDICKTKFVDGRLIVPSFILRELQMIADSGDVLKRTRGRRGLEILNELQKSPDKDVRIHNEDFPEIKETDAKLVKMAKVMGAKILTNDYNLNKIAELEGVTVLNINELANALRPVVLPGEVIEVKITKEGKEHNQGVAYLDDGTMVVVEDARHIIGRSVNVGVTSVLQTSAGRMIFARLMERDGQEGK